MTNRTSKRSGGKAQTQTHRPGDKSKVQGNSRSRRPVTDAKPVKRPEDLAFRVVEELKGDFLVGKG